MILAAIGDNSYNVMLLLHILTAVVAFAPAFVHPLLANQAKGASQAEQGRLLGFMMQNGRRVYAPALILSGLFGFGLQGLSDDAWKFSQTWLIGAVIVWIAMNGILHGLILPAERALADGDASAEPRLQVSGAAITVLLLVMLYLMIFKPGL